MTHQELRIQVDELGKELCLTHSSSSMIETQSSMVAMTHEDVSGTYGLMEELLVMVERKEDLDLHGLDERYNLENFDYTHSMHHGDYEPLLFGIPLTTQVITIDRGVEHIHCGLSIGEYMHPLIMGMDILRTWTH